MFGKILREYFAIPADLATSPIDGYAYGRHELVTANEEKIKPTKGKKSSEGKQESADVYNPTPAQWALAYERIQASKEKKDK